MSTGYLAPMPFVMKIKEFWLVFTKPAELAEYLWSIDDRREYQWHPVFRRVYDHMDKEFVVWCEANDFN